MPDALHLPQRVLQELMQYALEAAPAECCGLLLQMPQDGDTTSKIAALPIRNCANNHEYFEFDPHEQLRAWRQVRASAAQVLAVYHSHTSAAAIPGWADIALARMAFSPQVLQLILTPQARYLRKARCFYIAPAGQRIHAQELPIFLQF